MGSEMCIRDRYSTVDDKPFVIRSAGGTTVASFNASDADPDILLTPDGTGEVGIGTSTPSANLDIVGTLQYVDGNQGAGYVLTSDTSGHATWKSPHENADAVPDTSSPIPIKFQGGIIYVHPTVNATAMPWNDNTNTSATGATSHEDGETNSFTIELAQGSHGTPPYCAEVCRDLSAHGRSDWLSLIHI